MNRRVICICIVLLLSCAKQKMTIVMKEFEDKRIIADELVIQFLPSQPTIRLRDTFLKRSGDISKEINYLRFFEKNLPTYLKKYSTFREARFQDIISEFEKKEFELSPKDKFILYIPKSLATHDRRQLEGKYFLLLENFNIFRARGEADIMIPMDGSFLYIDGEEPKVVHRGKFLLWDNVTNKIISYGRINIRVNSEYKSDVRIMNITLDSLAKRIFSNSPFRANI